MDVEERGRGLIYGATPKFIEGNDEKSRNPTSQYRLCPRRHSNRVPLPLEPTQSAHYSK